jgi:hypothetical protein
MSATYKETISASIALNEKKLYKFRSFSGDEQKSRVKDILLNHRIRFSRLSELNDPTEGQPIFSLGDWNSVDYRKHFEDYIWHCQRNIAVVQTKEEFLAKFRLISKDAHEVHIREMVMKNQRVIENTWRILSLSANLNQELMWSHYSDSHKGLALVFDAFGGEFGMAFKVEYVQERKPLDVTTQNLNDILHATLLTKRISWAYEEEYRCIASEYPSELSPLPLKEQFFHFSPERLIGIVFGAKMPLDDKQTVLAWAKERPTPMKMWQSTIAEAGNVVVNACPT